MSFYSRVLAKAIKAGKINTADKILVVCGGEADRSTFLSAEFEHVVITNMDYHAGVTNYSPYVWERQDVEALTYGSDAFDWVVVHAGLHHCSSPHHALCEMLRVARNGVLFFEARDSLLIRMGVMLGLTTSFEVQCLAVSHGKIGGYRDTLFPNYIYRWTEREVEKTVNSFLPQFVHHFDFYYGYRIPLRNMQMATQRWKRTIAILATFVVPLLNAVLPKQGNEFACLISKRGPLRPWLRLHNDEIVPDMNYIEQRFNPEDY